MSTSYRNLADAIDLLTEHGFLVTKSDAYQDPDRDGFMPEFDVTIVCPDGERVMDGESDE